MAVWSLSDEVRRAATALWGIGTTLAGTTAVVALAHSMVGYALVYTTVALVLAVLAVATHRGNRAAHVVTLIGLGSQLVGAAGAAWELAYGSDDNAKAAHLHELGINYRLALAGNLAFSVLASLTFAWHVTYALRTRRQRDG